MNTRARGLPLLIPLLLLPHLSEAAPWYEWPEILPADNLPNDAFGNDVSVDAQRALIGAPGDDTRGAEAGAAYIYELQGPNWVQTAKLTPSGIGASDFFGSAAAIRGDRAIVGSYAIDGATNGVAYIYERVNGNWEMAERLRPLDVQQADGFGTSVDIDRDLAVVGAPGANAGAGEVYIFYRESFGWTHSTTIGTDAVAGDQLGESVGVTWRDNSLRLDEEDYWIAAGAPGADGGAGSVYVIERVFNVPIWSYDELTGSGNSTGDQFGRELAIDGQLDFNLAVGAPLDDPNGSQSGSVYLFRNPYGVDAWSEAFQIVPADGAAGDQFGASVGVAGDFGVWKILVGAPYDDDGFSNAGSVYLLKNSGASYNQSFKMGSAQAHSNSYFGRAVALDTSDWRTAMFEGASSTSGGSASPFTEHSMVTITGTKWRDRDNDGTRDPEDEGLENWAIYSDENDNGHHDTGESVGYTDSNGDYTLIRIPPGSHPIREIPQSGWQQSFPAGDNAHTVTVDLGETVAGLDFGNYEPTFTPTGINVTVEPHPSISVTFSEVIVEGQTQVSSTTANPGPAIPGFEFLGVFYDIMTTATYLPPLIICIGYDDTGMSFADELALRIQHQEDGDWVDVTSSINTADNEVCGTAMGNSYFALTSPGGVTGIGSTSPAARSVLHAAHPNPFNPATTLRFEIASARSVHLEIFDVSGRRIRTLVDGRWLEAGPHRYSWDGTDDNGRQLGSGIYYVRIQAGDLNAVRSAVLLK